MTGGGAGCSFHSACLTVPLVEVSSPPPPPTSSSISGLRSGHFRNENPLVLRPLCSSHSVHTWVDSGLRGIKLIQIWELC